MGTIDQWFPFQRSVSVPLEVRPTDQQSARLVQVIPLSSDEPGLASITTDHFTPFQCSPEEPLSPTVQQSEFVMQLTALRPLRAEVVGVGMIDHPTALAPTRPADPGAPTSVRTSTSETPSCLSLAGEQHMTALILLKLTRTCRESTGVTTPESSPWAAEPSERGRGGGPSLPRPRSLPRRCGLDRATRPRWWRRPSRRPVQVVQAHRGPVMVRRA